MKSYILTLENIPWLQNLSSRYLKFASVKTKLQWDLLTSNLLPRDCVYIHVFNFLTMNKRKVRTFAEPDINLKINGITVDAQRNIHILDESFKQMPSFVVPDREVIGIDLPPTGSIETNYR